MYTTLFLVTYKKLSSDPDLDETDYRFPMDRLRRNGNIVDYRFEHDSKSVYHLHAIYECRKNPYIRKFVVPGFNVNFTPIHDKDGAMDYINKCNPYYKQQVKYLFDASWERNDKERDSWWEKAKKKHSTAYNLPPLPTSQEKENFDKNLAKVMLEREYHLEL